MAFLGRKVEPATPVLKFLKNFAQSKQAKKEAVHAHRIEAAKQRQRRVKNMVHPVTKAPIFSASWRPDDEVIETRNADIVISHIPVVELPAYVRETIVGSMQPDAIFSGHTHSFDLHRHTTAHNVPAFFEKYSDRVIDESRNRNSDTNTNGNSNNGHKDDGDRLSGSDSPHSIIFEPLGSVVSSFTNNFQKFLYELGPKFPENYNSRVPEKIVVPEVTVPTLSYRMGTNKMGYTLSTVHVCDFPENMLDHVMTDITVEELIAQWPSSSLPFHPGHEWRYTSVEVNFANCSLPARFPWLVAYFILASLTVVSLLFYVSLCCCSRFFRTSRSSSPQMRMAKHI